MSTLKRVRRRALATVLSLCVCLCLALSAKAADVRSALNQVPENAPVVIVVPSLAGLSQKISMLNDAMGLGIPQLADALGEFKRSFNMNNGLREDGPLLLVVASLEGLENPGQGEPPVVMLVPVADYKAFIGNFQGADAEAAIAQLQGPNGQQLFARKADEFAVVGSDKALVEAFKSGGKGDAMLASAGKLGGKYLSGSDAAIYFNVPVMEPKLGPALQKAMAEAQAMAAQQQGAQGAPDPELMKAVLSMYNDLLTMMLRDTSAGVMALDINELGVGFTGAAQFKQGSQMAGFFKNGAAASDKLEKLPNQPYLMASAMNLEGLALKPLIEGVLNRLPANQQGGVAQVVRAALPLIEKTKSTAAAYYVPPQNAGLMGGLFQGLTIVETTDAKGYVQAFKDQLTALNQVKIEMPAAPAAPGADPGAADAQPEGPQAMTFTTQFTPNAIQIEGVTVDQYQLQYSFPPAMMQQMGQMGPMMMMMGGTGQTGYIAAVDDKMVVTTTTLSADIARQGIAALKAGKGLGTQQTITQVRQNLTPNPSVEAYLSVSGVMDVANPFMAMMGVPQIQVPQNLPPVGSSMSVQDGGAAQRLFVPSPVVRFVSDTIIPLVRGAAGGGMQGPQRGGPAPF
jgi:hypothetical protein